MGAPPRWRHVEPAGFKDAPHGRKRAVGILRRTEDGRYTVGGVPWLVTEAFPAAAALQGTSAVNVQLEAAVDRYVAVVGLPVGTLAVPVRRLGLMPDVRVPLLVPESVTVVTTMTPTADELMLVRGG